MKSRITVAMLVVLAIGIGRPICADDDKEAAAVLAKAIKAIDANSKLKADSAVTWKAKGTISFGGNDNEFTTQTTVVGTGKFRGEFEGDFGGQKVQGVTVINGDEGWRKFGDQVMPLDKDGLTNERRTVYLQVIPITLVALRGKDFKVVSAGQQKVGDAMADVLKVTDANGKEFQLFFDSATGLPMKQVAKVTGFMGDEFTQETKFSAYKDFDGIKRATKTESTRDGEKFLEVKVVEFKLLDKVDAKLFTEPK